jgi:hypothetical protein
MTVNDPPKEHKKIDVMEPNHCEILKRIFEEARKEVNNWPDTMKNQESSHRLSSQW